MKVKLHQIKDAFEVMKRIAKLEISVSVAFQLLSITKKIEAEALAFEETKNKLIMSMGEEDSSLNGTWRVKKENEQEFFQKIDELAKTECEIDILSINREMLLNEQTLKLSIAELAAIEWLLA